MDKDKEHQYLLQCFSNASEEIMFRVKHRDGWMKTQFIAQLSIVAMGLGISFGQIKPDSSLNAAFSLALPVSFIIAAWYFIEENIISLMSRYIASLNKKRDSILECTVINNFDSSRYANDFFKETQLLRIIAQIVAFLIVPSLIASFDIYINNYSHNEVIFRVFIDVICFLGLAIMMIVVHKERSDNLAEKI